MAGRRRGRRGARLGAQDERALRGDLFAEPLFEELRASTLEVLEADDRIPMPAFYDETDVLQSSGSRPTRTHQGWERVMAESWISTPANGALVAAWARACRERRLRATYVDALHGLMAVRGSVAGEVLRGLGFRGDIEPGDLQRFPPSTATHPDPLLCELQMLALRDQIRAGGPPVDTISLLLTLMRLDSLAVAEIGLRPADVELGMITAAAHWKANARRVRLDAMEAAGNKRLSPEFHVAYAKGAEHLLGEVRRLAGADGVGAGDT